MPELPENSDSPQMGDSCPPPCSASCDRVPPPPIIWLQLLAEDELGATWTEKQVTPDDTAYTRISDDLLCEVDQMQAEIAKLRADCRKYRLALNRVASPKNWGVHEGYHVEIARRALLIGGKCDPLPDGALILPNEKN